MLHLSKAKDNQNAINVHKDQNETIQASILLVLRLAKVKH